MPRCRAPLRAAANRCSRRWRATTPAVRWQAGSPGPPAIQARRTRACQRATGTRHRRAARSRLRCRHTNTESRDARLRRPPARRQGPPQSAPSAHRAAGCRTAGAPPSGLSSPRLHLPEPDDRPSNAQQQPERERAGVCLQQHRAQRAEDAHESCRDDGWSSAPSLGLAVVAASPRTSRRPSPAQLLGSSSPISGFSHDVSPSPDYSARFLSQTLRMRVTKSSPRHPPRSPAP